MDAPRAADEADGRRRAPDDLVHDERVAQMAVVQQLEERQDAASARARLDDAVPRRDGRRLAAPDEARHLREEVALVERAHDALSLEALDEDRR